MWEQYDWHNLEYWQWTYNIQINQSGKPDSTEDEHNKQEKIQIWSFDLNSKKIKKQKQTARSLEIGYLHNEHTDNKFWTELKFEIISLNLLKVAHDNAYIHMSVGKKNHLIENERNI